METLADRQLALGGEQSGHVIFPDVLTTGDGLVTTLMVLQAMAATGRELGDLAGELTMYPQVTVNVPVRKTTSLENVPDVSAVIAEVERRLVGQEGQLLVRYSGTEPLLRITLQGSDQGDIERWAEEIAEVVRRRLG
jgi:phosphoglucosamine mutase